MFGMDTFFLISQWNAGVFKVIVPTILAFFKELFKVAKLRDDIIKHRLNPIASIKTLVKHKLKVLCIMGALIIVFLSSKQKFDLE